MVSSSAIGTASQTPITPISLGKITSSTRISPKVRKNDIIADIFPLDKAVYAAEVKIFNPQNKKLYGKTKNPLLAIS